MSLTRTLHVKIDSELERELKRLSADRGVSIGEIVRKAVKTTYRIGVEGLSARHHDALTAHQAGYISLGKLAEELGMDVLTLRRWMAVNDFESHETFGVSDAEHV